MARLALLGLGGTTIAANVTAVANRQTCAVDLRLGYTNDAGNHSAIIATVQRTDDNAIMRSIRTSRPGTHARKSSVSKTPAAS